MTIRIVVADDHPVVREGLIAMLSTQTDFEVVSEASNGKEAVRLVEALQPDVVLLDLEMPQMDGVAVLEHFRDSGSNTRVLVFTVFDTDERILRAVQAGARGYLLKGAPREELFRAVRVVHAGGSLLQPLVASKLIEQMRREHHTATGPNRLTRREQEILHLLAQGLPNKEIADQLYISERTVKFHVSTILRKLEAGNRTEAVARAVDRGLIRR